MSSFAEISIGFHANLKQFSSQIDNANRKMQKMGQRMSSVGQNMTIGLTAPIIAFGYKSAEAFNQQAKAETALRTALKGNAKAFENLTKQASAFQDVSLFGDEAIIRQQAFLSTMELNEQQIGKVIQAAMNLSAATGMSLESAVKNLAKTYGGLTGELGESIPALRNLTKEQLISGEAINYVNDAFAGQAKAAAKAGTGGIKQLTNSLGDLAEEFGAIVMEYINPFVNKLQGLVDRFKELSPATKKVIVTVAALAAAIGPLSMGIGFLMTTVMPGLISALPALGAAFTALTGPIGLVVAAIAGIGYMVYKHWDKIKKQMVDLQNYFIDLYNESVIFRTAVEQVILTFKTLYNIAKLVIDILVTGFTNAASLIIDSFKNIGAAFKAVLTGDFDELPKIFARQNQVIKNNFSELFNGIGEDFSNFTDSMKQDFSSAVDAITKRKKITFEKDNIDTSAISEKVAEAVKQGINTGIGGSGSGNTGGNGGGIPVNEYEDAKKNFEEVQQLIADTGGNVAAKIGEGEWATLDQKMSNAYESFKKMGEGIAEESNKVNSKMQEFANTMNSALESGFSSAAEHFGNFLAGVMTGKANAQKLFSGLLGVVGSFMKTLGKALVAVGTASEAFKNAFASGWGAIAAGVALIALSGVVKNIFSEGVAGGGGVKIPALANGGLAYEPTLGLIGEYSGARTNPEVIAPLDKLKGMIRDVVPGSPSGEVQFKLRGQDLIGSFKQAEAYKARRG